MIDGVRVTVEVDDDGRPVVVKTAEHDGVAPVLAREAERLTRARHPGVVELVAAEPGRLVLAWAGTHTLETLAPAPDGAATVVAALAATVSDLHRLGIVHGRISPAHVVVDEAGRPRLCGLRGPDAGEPGPGPAEDVAALGRLIDHLLGADADAEPIPEHRWGRKRWTGYQRRALLTLADQATDPDPARRPTARALAAAIADLVPEARFERPAGREPLSAPVEPWDELVERRAEDGVDRVPGEAGADETEAAGTDDATDVAGVTRFGDPQPPDVARLGAADAAGGDRPLESEPEPAVDWDDVWERLDPGTAEPDRFLGLRLEPPGADEPSPPPRPAPSRLAPSQRPTTALRRPATAASVVAVLVAAALLAWPRPSTPPTVPLLPEPATTTVATATPAAAIPAGACRSDQVEAAEDASPATSDGTGSAGVGVGSCAGPVELVGNLIHVGDRWFEAGRAGDRIAVGDWDCDGTVTPALVRPATGEIFVFDRWASEEGDVTATALGSVPSAVALEPPPEGTCRPPTVRLADGTTRELHPAAGTPR